MRGRGHRFSSFAAGICLLAATAAHAQVYRCESGGVIRYSDKPCGRDAERVELRPAIVVPSGPKADLLGEARKREQAALEARQKEDAEFSEANAARKADEERLRNARVAGTVVEGMSAADVRHLRGDPAVVSRSEAGGKARETWSYVLDDGARLHVTLTDGRVSSVRTRKAKK